MRNKEDVVNYVKDKTGYSKTEIEKIINGFLEAIRYYLKSGENVQLRGFGTFSLKKSKERVGRNPRTGEEIRIPSKSRVSFIVGKKLKELED